MKGRQMIGSFAASPLPRRRLLLAALIALAGPLALLQPAGAGLAQTGARTAWVLLNAGTDNSTMSGSTDDLRRARALRAGREGLFYVRQNGTFWVIRDAATLRRAEAIFAPQRAMGARQAALGSRQAALGSRQAALGSQQATLGGQQALLGSRQANATPRTAAALAGQQEALGRQQDALGRQQDELGRQQDVLGRQQDALGREQDRLGREADVQLRALVAEAIRSGVAQRTN
jgi:bla regulator protein BlaR1